MPAGIRGFGHPATLAVGPTTVRSPAGCGGPVAAGCDRPYPSGPMTLAERIRERELTTGERRVADLVLGDPSLLAFGSVATVAAEAGVGNSTVMRFAAKVGFAGFTELQDAARDGDGRPAAPGDPPDPAAPRRRSRRAAARDVELANLQETFARIDPTVARAASDALAAAGGVAVIAGDTARGVAQDFATSSAWCDPASRWPTSAPSRPAGRSPGSVPTTCSSRSTRRGTKRGSRPPSTRATSDAVHVLAVTDSHVSPIARVATWSFQVVDTGAGPFDSFVATLALTNLLVTLAARRLGRKAVRHIDRLDAAWGADGVLRPD